MKKETLTKLTSVKILKSLYEQFKFKTVNSSMNLQKLVNRSIHQYIHDNAIQEQIENILSNISNSQQILEETLSQDY